MNDICVIDKKQSDCLKGLLALIVVVHHILQYTRFTNLFAEYPKVVQFLVGDFVQSLGVLSVAFFFFLSGYGIRFSYARNGYAYAQKMFRNKILPFYGIVLFSALLYLLLRIIIGKATTTMDFLATFGFGKTIIVNGWYLQAILVLYILFALFYRRQKAALYDVLIIIFGYEVVALGVMRLSSWWFQTVPAFALGFYWRDIAQLVERIPIKWMLVMMVAARAMVKIVNHFHLHVGLPIYMGYILIICLIFFKLFGKINFVNSVTTRLSKVYFEIYVCHGIFLYLYHSRVINITNGILYGIAVFVSAIAFAYLIHPVFRWILRR